MGLAIQAALANQKRIGDAVKQTQDYAAEMLRANAAAIRQQTTEIGDLQNNPVLALDKVKEAYTDLVGAMDEMDRIRREGAVQAKAGIQALTEMTAKLAPKVDALRAAGQTPQSEGGERSAQ